MKADQIYKKLVDGTRSFVRERGFEGVVLGLSGGIDSSLTAAVAAEALGAANVQGISLPTEYTSKASVADAEKVAGNLGISFQVISIQKIFDEARAALKDVLKGEKCGLTEQNLQARIRGMVLMAYANRRGLLLLSCGNRSEAMVGYCTLYGDTCGSLAVIGDLYKHQVYEVARHVNRKKEIIPKAVFEKPPTAELAPGQKDEDDIPPYDKLDKILALLLDEKKPKAEAVKAGFDKALVDRVVELMKKSEFKRQQSPPSIKLSGGLRGAEAEAFIQSFYLE